MRPGAELLAEGRALARTWQVGTNLFLRTAGVSSEAAYKRAAAAAGRTMQHAHVGFRSVARTAAAMAEIHGRCADRGAVVDRFGITLDWSMGYPERLRSAARVRGTGIVLSGPEDFGRITDAAPAAAHFGDFMLGLPGALNNTRAALAAGATTIGNLGQYFTFRLPGWDDDVATTEATVAALGLIAAQKAEILVHSNLDDGFAGLFADASSALGMALVEKHVVEGLIGARLGHCYGHHFAAPLLRLAFHRALSEVSSTCGTMIYGATVSYRGSAASNWASLASYLSADLWALRRRPTGHAVNPVPVTENERIPDVDEIVDAQLFAARLAEHAAQSSALVDWGAVDAVADRLVEGGRRFAASVLGGLARFGVAVDDPAAVLLALRRIGPKRLEALFGAGALDPSAPNGRSALVQAEWIGELEALAAGWLARQDGTAKARIEAAGLRICVGASDVHEHGKHLVERVLAGLGAVVVDGGVSADPGSLVQAALAGRAELIAVSTYNGVALRYARDVLRALRDAGADLPVCMGGKLNQVPEESNSGLPVDVRADIADLGVAACASLDDLLPVLDRLAASRAASTLVIAHPTASRLPVPERSPA